MPTPPNTFGMKWDIVSAFVAELEEITATSAPKSEWSGGSYSSMIMPKILEWNKWV